MKHAKMCCSNRSTGAYPLKQDHMLLIAVLIRDTLFLKAFLNCVETFVGFPFLKEWNLSRLHMMQQSNLKCSLLLMNKQEF